MIRYRPLLFLVLAMIPAFIVGACEAPEWPTETPAPPATATPRPSDTPAPSPSPTELPATTQPTATEASGVPTAEPASDASIVPAPSATAESETDAAATDSSATAAAEGSSEGSVLRVAIDTPSELDPAKAASIGEIALVRAIYDRLVEVEDDGRLTPNLAESWTALDGGRVYDIALVSDAWFHHDEPLTSSDVVWSLNRLRDPGIGLPVGDLFTDVLSVEAIGRYRVLIHLSEPDPAFMARLGDDRASIVSRDAADPSVDPNGTGPFELQSWRADEGALLNANDRYHIAGKPRASSLEFRFYYAPVYALRALRAGSVQVALSFPATECAALAGDPGITVVYGAATEESGSSCTAARDSVFGLEPRSPASHIDLAGVAVR